ncbi:MAG: response regulator [Chloroflexi bacterium]|nr:response regulator [Chloroflexota bacterium]
MSSLNVILVDDEEFLRDVIEEGLVELFGCTVRSAPDGATGLKCLREGGADVLLLDLLMPGLNGFDVLEQLQTGEDTANRPGIVVVMSGLTDRSTMQTLRNFGVDAILPKPFSFKELRAVMRLGEPREYGEGRLATQSA